MMLTTYHGVDAHYLKRKARSIALQAGRSSSTLAAQLRVLAAQYYAEAEALIRDVPMDVSGRGTLWPESCGHTPHENGVY